MIRTRGPVIDVSAAASAGQCPRTPAPGPWHHGHSYSASDTLAISHEVRMSARTRARTRASACTQLPVFSHNILVPVFSAHFPLLMFLFLLPCFVVGTLFPRARSLSCSSMQYGFYYSSRAPACSMDVTAALLLLQHAVWILLLHALVSHRWLPGHTHALLRPAGRFDGCPPMARVQIAPHTQ